MASERLTPDEGSLSARLRRALGHPLLATAFLFVIAADLFLVMSYWSFRYTDCQPSGLTDVVVIDGPDGPQLMDPYQSADQLSAAIQRHPERVFQLARQSHDHTGRLLAPWWHRHGAHYTLHPLGQAAAPPPEAVTDVARDHIATHYMPHEDATTSNLGDPPRTQTRLDWPGIIHDLIMLPLAALAIVNLFFVPGYLRRRRREHRLARGLCPRCRYPIAGLPAGAITCPECGEQIASRTA